MGKYLAVSKWVGYKSYMLYILKKVVTEGARKGVQEGARTIILEGAQLSRYIDIDGSFLLQHYLGTRLFDHSITRLCNHTYALDNTVPCSGRC